MTANSFRVKLSDPRAASRYFPGDAYVDAIGADAFPAGQKTDAVGHGRAADAARLQKYPDGHGEHSILASIDHSALPAPPRDLLFEFAIQRTR